MKFEEEEKEQTRLLKYTGWIVLIIFGVFLFFAERVDAATVAYNSGFWTTNPIEAYNASSDDMLIVAVAASTVDDCTASYDGVSMTSAGTPSLITTADQYQYIFWLGGPFTGTANIEINCTSYAGAYIEGFEGSDTVSGYDITENDDISGDISLFATVANPDSAVISICGTRFGPVPCTPSTGVTVDITDGGAQMGIGYSLNSTDTTHNWTGTISVSKAMNILVLEPCVGACPEATSTPSTSTSTAPTAPYIPFLGAIIFFFSFWTMLGLMLWTRK